MFVLIMIVVMMMLVFVLILIMIVVMVMLMPVLIMVMVMMVMVMMFLIIHCRIIFEILHDIFNICGMLHSFQYLCTGNVIPRSRNNSCLRIMLTDLFSSLKKLLLSYILGSGKNHSSRCLDLVKEEFTEILHVNLSLGHIHNRCCGIQLDIHGFSCLLDSLDNIGKLAYARRFNDYPVRMVLLNHLLQSFAEISHKRAADTSGIQLIYLNTCILHKIAVHTDLTEFVLDQDKLLALKCFIDKFLDKCRLSGT